MKNILTKLKRFENILISSVSSNRMSALQIAFNLILTKDLGFVTINRPSQSSNNIHESRYIYVFDSGENRNDIENKVDTIRSFKKDEENAIKQGLKVPKYNTQNTIIRNNLEVTVSDGNAKGSYQIFYLKEDKPLALLRISDHKAEIRSKKQSENETHNFIQIQDIHNHSTMTKIEILGNLKKFFSKIITDIDKTINLNNELEILSSDLDKSGKDVEYIDKRINNT